MKLYAKKLGIDENLYFLFACMVTGRPWETIKNGIGTTKPGQTEVVLIIFLYLIIECIYIL